jgi:hypothetical protein
VSDVEAFDYYEAPARRKPPPGSPRRRPEQSLAQHVPVRFPSETIQRVKSVADAEGVTASAWIRRAVDEKLRRHLVEDPLRSHS